MLPIRARAQVADSKKLDKALARSPVTFTAKPCCSALQSGLFANLANRAPETSQGPFLQSGIVSRVVDHVRDILGRNCLGGGILVRTAGSNQ